MPRLVYLMYDFDYSNSWADEAREQILKRGESDTINKKGKVATAKIQDRILLSKLRTKNGTTKVDLVRLHLYIKIESGLMALQAVYRSYREDGTVRETPGEKYFFKQGLYKFRNENGETTKIAFARNGTYIDVRTQSGIKARLNPRIKLKTIRC